MKDLVCFPSWPLNLYHIQEEVSGFKLGCYRKANMAKFKILYFEIKPRTSPALLLHKKWLSCVEVLPSRNDLRADRERSGEGGRNPAGGDGNVLLRWTLTTDAGLPELRWETRTEGGIRKYSLAWQQLSRTTGCLPKAAALRWAHQ